MSTFERASLTPSLPLDGSLPMTGDLEGPDEFEVSNGQGEGISFSQAANTTKLVRAGVDRLTVGTGVVIPHIGEGIRDDADRQFVRTAFVSTAKRVNDYGILTATTTAAGNLTITFGVTFADVPRLLTTVRRNASATHVAHILTITTSSATVRVTAGGSALVSTEVDLHWDAAGFVS